MIGVSYVCPYAASSSLPQHLVQWDAGNPECLLQLVKELIQQYHHYQCQRLRESSRLLFEYDSLLEDPNYGRNMEIYAGRKNSWVGMSFYFTEPREGHVIKYSNEKVTLETLIPKSWSVF